MKHSISTLLTTLLFSVAIVPNAMAQMQQPGFPVGSAPVPEQPASDSTQPTSIKTEVLPESPKNTTSSVSTMNSEKLHSNVDSSYPAYCPSLPPRTKPGDWEYREALYNCLYGL